MCGGALAKPSNVMLVAGNHVASIRLRLEQ
jgi:hypothetical protein